MSFDIPTSIEHDIERYAAEERLSPDAALLQLIQTGLQQKRPGRATPIEEGLGLLGSPADVAVLDEALELIYGERRQPSIREANL